MASGIQVTTDQKDWDDFFAPELNHEDAIDPMDLYAERVRVACELSGRKIQKTNQRLVESTPKKIRVQIEFEFDR
jgi:hypothetical protein